MSTWKLITHPSENVDVEYTPVLESRKFFAVDDSGSTAGTVLRRERTFVDAIRSKHANSEDSISLWGHKCDIPTGQFESIRWRSDHGGTHPTTILTRQPSLDAIRNSDVWFLLTDGEIPTGQVHRLAELAFETGILNVPLVFVITGSKKETPSTTDISVGISFFASAQDTLILFKETSTGKIYVIAGKGCFASLGGSAAAQDLESWSDLQVFPNEDKLFAHLKKLEIQVVMSAYRIASGMGVSLGPDWEARQGGPVRVDLDALPQAGWLSDNDIFDLLAEDTFAVLAIAYKTRSRIAELRGFLQQQKAPGQIMPKLEDIAGATNILTAMADAKITDAERKRLQRQLREAHAKNREYYQRSSAEFAGSEMERTLRKRNQLVDAALSSLASLEAASFSAEILSRRSNRARRAELVDVVTAIEVEKLDLDVPAQKGFCLVCCGEDEIMSICFKAPEPNNAEDNTTDFALNFPLAAGAAAKNVSLISSQNVCFQCALASPGGRSIYQEELTAIIPAVKYIGTNKKYINDQLYLALTAKLATGAAGISQLFMAILQEVLRTKPWAGAGMTDANLTTDEQHEALQRRLTFEWMLEELIQNTFTRTDFKETGEWVKYPEALRWVAEDFEANGLASFAVTYPAAGFNNLLTLGTHTKAFSEDQLQHLKSAKIIHSIASKYLAELQVALANSASNTDDWKQKYLEVIYQDFNGPLIPTDKGSTSIVTNINAFISRLNACISTPTLIHTTPLMPKIQLLLFWLLFHQKNHCTAQTFFARLQDTQPLATAVLSPTLLLPEKEASSNLLSIFAQQDAHPINPKAAQKHTSLIPFANPFGASVLHCGLASCGKTFSKIGRVSDVNVRSVQAIRDARTKHLVEVFGLAGRFEASLTGLPERADAGHPPTSIHSNLHITIVREWAARDVAERGAIVGDEGKREEFVQAVRRGLCLEGRGNVYQEDLDHETRILLPSFFGVLKVAVEMEGGTEVVAYEHDFGKNKMEWKVRWEMEAVKKGKEVDDWEVV